MLRPHRQVCVILLLHRACSPAWPAAGAQAVMYMLLTWQDERAAAAVNASTKAAQSADYNNGDGCAYPCTTIYAWDRNPNAINLW